MPVVVKIGRKQILNEAEALETDTSVAPPSASKYGGARAGSQGLYYVGKQRGGEAEDEAEKKIIAGINSLEYPDSLVNLLNKSNIGDRAEIRRIFTQDTVGELVDLIRSFQLGVDKEKEFAKLLNFWGRLNTVKFEPPPKPRAGAPVEEPKPAPGSGLSPTLVPDTEQYQESRTWQEDRLLYSEQVANELLRRTIKA